MPTYLTVDQWKQLISLTDSRSRFHYLDSLYLGEKTFEEIQEFDAKCTNPMEMPKDLEDEVCGDDAAAKKKVLMFLHFVSIFVVILDVIYIVSVYSGGAKETKW